MGCSSSKPDVATDPPAPPAVKKVATPQVVKEEARAVGELPPAAPGSTKVSTPSSKAISTAGPSTPVAPGGGDDDGAPDSPTDNAETNLDNDSEKLDDVPLMRYGQLRKQSGGMLVKNWRRRNFTVEKGVLKYYELFIKEYPYGEREKGCFSLQGYTVVQDPNPREPNQILLQSAESKTFDLLVEADDNKKKATWVAIFNDHIVYADKYKVVTPQRLNPEDAKYKTSTRF